MMYDIEISKNLKKVKYGGYVYKVKKVIKNSKYSRHRCVDNLYYTIDYDWFFKLGKRTYIVSFCNKCKTLFMRSARAH